MQRIVGYIKGKRVTVAKNGILPSVIVLKHAGFVVPSQSGRRSGQASIGSRAVCRATSKGYSNPRCSHRASLPFLTVKVSLIIQQ